MTAKEYAWCKRLEIATKRDVDKLTDFEKKFCADFFATFQGAGQKMTITKKQWYVLVQLTDKVIS